MLNDEISRREALRALAAAAAAVATVSIAGCGKTDSDVQNTLAATASGNSPAPADTTSATAASRAPLLGRVPMTTLGRKKVAISRFVVGGHHCGAETTEEEAAKIYARSFELGINFLDSAHSYPNSEQRIANAIAGRNRNELVLMSKSTKRDAAESERELDAAIKGLGTDHLDVWQFHAINNNKDAEAILAPGGAYETAKKALADGRIKMLGATSHNSPEALVKILTEVPELDVVQFPVNCVDVYWRSFIQGALPAARARGVSVLAMKTLARGTLTKVEKITTAEALRYAMSQPVTAFVSGVTTLAQLEENVRVLLELTPMTTEEQKVLVAKSAEYQGAKFEDYKTWT